MNKRQIRKRNKKNPTNKVATPQPLNEKRWGHPDPRLDEDPSRQLQPVKRSSALSTASASASTLSTWD